MQFAVANEPEGALAPRPSTLPHSALQQHEHHAWLPRAWHQHVASRPVHDATPLISALRTAGRHAMAGVCGLQTGLREWRSMFTRPMRQQRQLSDGDAMLTRPGESWSVGRWLVASCLRLTCQHWRRDLFPGERGVGKQHVNPNQVLKSCESCKTK